MVETEISKLPTFLKGSTPVTEQDFWSEIFLVALIIFVFFSFRHDLDDNLDMG